MYYNFNDCFEMAKSFKAKHLAKTVTLKMLKKRSQCLRL